MHQAAGWWFNLNSFLILLCDLGGLCVKFLRTEKSFHAKTQRTQSKTKVSTAENSLEMELFQR